MSIFGIDHAWGRPGPAALKHAGVKFVCRYLSYDPPKNLSHAEAEVLSDAGIWITVVWETTANRALSGRTGGIADAREAAKQAKACGMPDDRPIYFAVDWDASSSQQATINAYLDGAASVIGRNRVGMYAGYGPIKRAFDAKKITFGWQTYAWSGGRWDSRAQLQQYSNDHTLNGVGCDYDRAMKNDYGQWRVGVTPKEDDVTPEDRKAIIDGVVGQIADRVWKTDSLPAPVGSAVGTNPTWQADSLLKDTNERTRAILGALSKSSDPNVDTAAIVAGVLAGLSPATIAQAVTDAMPAELAQQVVSELSTRLKP